MLLLEAVLCWLPVDCCCPRRGSRERFTCCTIRGQVNCMVKLVQFKLRFRFLGLEFILLSCGIVILYKELLVTVMIDHRWFKGTVCFCLEPAFMLYFVYTMIGK